MGNRVAWEVSQGRIGPAYASAAKVFGTESLIEVYRLLLDVVGPQGIVKQGSPGALLHGKLERGYRECQINTFGGGVAEVMRDMVAQFGMGLPRIAR
jgi:alkylation response protein AidB-like acyl-CoA dehydrogenase